MGKQEKLLKVLFFFLLLTDLGYSFLQYYHQPIQGDLIPVILPEPQFSQVLEEPFGFTAIQQDINYGGVNRYFVHQALYWSFRNIPLWLQNFLDPIESLYATAALFKLLFHVALILLLSRYLRPNDRFWTAPFLGTALLITPFFQANGYSHVIGIVDRSVVYAFSYALPILLLMLYFLPFYRYIFHSSRVRVMKHPVQHLIWFFLMVWLAFSGPLIAPLVLMICPAVLIGLIWQFYRIEGNLAKAFQRIPKAFLFHFIIFILLNLYSFYLGAYNSENDATFSLAERYARLPIGFYKLFVRKLALPLLFLLLLVNFGIIRRKVKHYWRLQTGQITLCCLLFILAYLLLLPMGGYRIYRPYILRYDTFLPITLTLIFLFAQTFHLILPYLKRSTSKDKQTSGRNLLHLYLPFIFFVFLIFMIADSPKWDKNYCEKKALYQIQNSKEKVILLETKCPVLEWKTFSKIEESRYIAEMLKHWNITNQEVLFHHQ